MPESITLEDGSTREIPTEDELKELQAKAEEAGKTTELQEQLEKQTTELEELRKQPGGEGIKNLRDALKRTKAALKAAGKDVDDEGNVTEKSDTLTKEDVASVAQATVEKAAVQQVLVNTINQLDSDSKAVFEKEYKELTEGKEITQVNVQKFIDATMSISGLQEQASAGKDPMANFSGGSPRGASGGGVSAATEEIGKGFGISKESLEKGGGVDIFNK